MGHGATKTLVVPASGGVVGSLREADVRVDAASVAPQHVRLTPAEDWLQIEDLGASDTWVAGQKLKPAGHAQLRVGQSLRIGDAVLILQPNNDKSSTSGATMAAPAARRAGAVVVNDTMAGIHHIAMRIAKTPIAILLLGEAGVGKEFVARIVHDQSERCASSFIAVKCASLPASHVERILFGQERRANGVLLDSEPGLVERANGGTLFLNGVHDLPPIVQAKLVRILEDKELMRVGAVAPTPCDARFIAASSEDLAEAVASGSFREDLHELLNGAQLRIPPLRERADELEALALHFLERLCAAQPGRKAPSLEADALAQLKEHAWPGNLGELRSVLQRALNLCGAGPMQRRHLPWSALAARAVPRVWSSSLEEELEGLEKQRILEALASSNGVDAAAKRLGISNRSFERKLAKYNIRRA